jgi:hypothetical protein
MKPEKRLDVYLLALAEIKKDQKTHPDYFTGLCYYISRSAAKSGHVKSHSTGYDYMGKYYPEINKQRPKRFFGGDYYWFPKSIEGQKTRIQVIETAIAQVQAQILIKKESNE